MRTPTCAVCGKRLPAPCLAGPQLCRAHELAWRDSPERAAVFAFKASVAKVPNVVVDRDELERRYNLARNEFVQRAAGQRGPFDREGAYVGR